MNELKSKGKELGQKIGRIQRVRLREVWSHEALNFTTWLEENIDVLVEATGLKLSGVEREQAVGTISVDFGMIPLPHTSP